jgi:UDP-2-acetamido-2,6-beta-L-arabino-hexul-4-ose reductase
MDKTVLVTGSDGFIGKNLCSVLEAMDSIKLLKYDFNNSEEELVSYLGTADFVFHLAGINRPGNVVEFQSGNAEFTEKLIGLISRQERKIPVLFSSSIQAEIDNPYGQSKLNAENFVFKYGMISGADVFVYRLPNVFGKWCRPNYNSAVATFCNNIANDLEVTVNDPSVIMTLAYIDDVVGEFVNTLQGNANRVGDYCEIRVTHKIELGKIVDLLYSFKESRSNLYVPDMEDSFTRKLYSTYLSYLPKDGLSYSLKMNVDERGSFTEFMRSPDRGQVSINISKPCITKGNHWHHSKNEKFLVVSGKGVIRFRKIGSKEVVAYYVSGEKLEVVDIPPGYTHNIENLGDEDMVTVIWVNEVFNPGTPDTLFQKV